MMISGLQQRHCLAQAANHACVREQRPQPSMQGSAASYWYIYY